MKILKAPTLPQRYFAPFGLMFIEKKTYIPTPSKRSRTRCGSSVRAPVLRTGTEALGFGFRV